MAIVFLWGCPGFCCVCERGKSSQLETQQGRSSIFVCYISYICTTEMSRDDGLWYPGLWLHNGPWVASIVSWPDQCSLGLSVILASALTSATPTHIHTHVHSHCTRLKGGLGCNWVSRTTGGQRGRGGGNVRRGMEGVWVEVVWRVTPGERWSQMRGCCWV